MLHYFLCLLSIAWLFLLGCQYQCKWQTGKILLWNDLWCVDGDTEPYSIPLSLSPFSICPQTQFGEDRCTQFRVIMVTDPQTQPHTHRQDRLKYTALQLAHSVMTSNHCIVSSTIDEKNRINKKTNHINFIKFELIYSTKINYELIIHFEKVRTVE